MSCKSSLRKYIRSRKVEFSADQLADMSRSVCEAVLSSEQWGSAHTVFLYNSLKDEVDTALLLRTAIEQGKRVLLPVVIDDENMELRIYTGSESMQSGPYGILEPIGEVFPETEYASITLAVIPGMAFDKANHRLGRGKGYYDRMLPKLTDAYRIGICFPFQMLEDIPSDEYDVLMHQVIS